MAPAQFACGGGLVLPSSAPSDPFHPSPTLPSPRPTTAGKYQPKYVETLLRKYIAEFVQCHMCRNVETDLRRDNVSRLFFMDCKACGSSRSVAPIKAGFHATSKGERRKARDAATN